jgi:quercetin dioxygenase-like cupin family protein
MKLPEDLEEQAALYSLGLLDENDRKAFLVRLRGDSLLLRQTVVAYQAVTDALATVVDPVSPSPLLREKMIDQVAREGAREAKQFELAVNTLAFGAVPPLKPHDSIRERLLARIEGDAAVRHVGKDPAHGLAGTQAAGSQSHRRSQAWRHLLVTSYTSMQLCWKAFVHFLRTLPLSSGPSASKTTRGVQQLSKGLTFIEAAEGVWQEIAPGVTAKVLSLDAISRRATALLRIAPGTGYAPHRHTEMEELFVLEGGCLCGGRELKVGDYHRAEAGTEHHDTSSDDGCLLLVISSPQNEMLP